MNADRANRMKILEEDNKAKEAIKAEKEAQDLKLLRQNLVHKPEPRKSYSYLARLPKKNTKVETLPQTPQIALTKRVAKLGCPDLNRPKYRKKDRFLT